MENCAFPLFTDERRFEPLNDGVTADLSTVRKARDTTTGEFVALKTCNHDAGDYNLSERRQCEIMYAVRSRATLRLRGLLIGTNASAMVMDWIEAPTLVDWLKSNYKHRGGRPLRPLEDVGETKTLLRIVSLASRALQRVHERGFLHRDVKPQNMFVHPHAALFDFGVAARIADEQEEGFATGTPGYIAPESWEGFGIGPHSDVYGLGVTLYAALTDMLPVPNDDVADCANATVLGDWYPVREMNPSVPEQIASLCENSMHKVGVNRPPLPVFRKRIRSLLSQLP